MQLGSLARWIKRDGSFRARRLLLGWDNVPMHRWAQSQMFRSLALLLCSGAVARRAEPMPQAGMTARSANVLSATAH